MSDLPNCSCVKDFRIDIKRIDEHIFVVEDNSIHVGTDMEAMSEEEIEIEIETPQKEVFLVSVPLNGRRAFDNRDFCNFKMHDGVYCVSTISCGDKFSAKVFYAPNLKCKIDSISLKNGMSEEYMKMLNQYKHMKVLAEYGRDKQAEKLFDNLKKMLNNCVR